MVEETENKELTNEEVTPQEETTTPQFEEVAPAEEADELDHEPAPLAAKKVVVEDEDDDDWWKDEDEYTNKERAEMAALYEGTLREFNENEIVAGTVVSVNEKEVLMNIGFKSEGVVPINEFRDSPNLKAGDKLEVFIESVEDREGQLILSRKRAKNLRSWEQINASMDKDVILRGHVMRRTKGGFVVDIDGIEAFLPGSQIDVKPVRDFDAYVGRDMEFKVVKINHAYENVVVSHKVLIEAKLEEQRTEILQNLEKGQVLEGTVKNMTNFGVFIDLGGVDGLLHITDISWGRINHPEEVLDLDQKVNVVVLDFDDAKKRISLGMKQLTSHPWDSLPEGIVENTVVKGKVVTVADYGVFLEILPGVEGLIHTSEMSWSQHGKNPTEQFEVNQELEAMVLSIDREERKMSLGLKQLLVDPWSEVIARFPVGSRHNGLVRNMTNYGLFVELQEGIDGLVHISDLSWTKKFSHPSEYVKVGQELEVVVLDIDVENRRLSLGHKQLTEDVWETFASIFTVGSTQSGTIKKIDSKGAVVELEYGVEGSVPKRHLKVEDGKEELKVDDATEFVVIEFNKDAKRLVLSHTRTWQHEPDSNVGASSSSSSSSSSSTSGADKKKRSGAKPSGAGAAVAKAAQASTTTLGELDALQKLKEQMMEAEEKGSSKKASKAKTEEAADEDAPEVEDVVADVEDVVEETEAAIEEVADEVETAAEEAEDAASDDDDEAEKEG